MTLVLLPPEWIALAVFVTAAYIELFTINYLDYNHKGVRLALPRDVFPIAWIVLKGLIGVSGFFFWRTYDRDGGATFTNDMQTYYSVGLFMLFGSIVASKMWSVLFFGLDMTGAAFVNALVIAGAGSTYMVMAGLIGTTNTWIAFGLAGAYVVCTWFAVLLNGEFLVRGVGTTLKKSTKA